MQPGIDSFNQHLKDQAAAYDRKVSDISAELEKLRARNEITALADAAEGRGDVEAYRSLRKMALVSNPPDGATAEFLRAFGTFTNVLGPTIEPQSPLNAAAIHPGKSTEDQLETADLLPLLSNDDIFVRMKAGMLLAKVAKPGSYATARAIIEAIRKEPNLWVMKKLKPAFAQAVSYRGLSFADSGNVFSPDGQNALDWWTTHEADVKAHDSDVPVAPKSPAK